MAKLIKVEEMPDIPVDLSHKLLRKEDVFPELKRIREDIEENFGSGYRSRDDYAYSQISPALVKFREVQRDIYRLGREDLPIGEKRRKAVGMIWDFKKFLLSQNIRYREIWKFLRIPGY